MTRSKSNWSNGLKINDVDYNQYVLMIAGIDNEQHILFNDLLLLESSLNANMEWNILQILIQNTINKHLNNS